MEQFNEERMILNMKKLGLILGMIVCIFCLTACGSATETETTPKLEISEDELNAYADQVVNDINSVVLNGMQAQFSADSVIAAALTSWESAQEDMGTFQNITGHETEIGEDSATVIVQISGTVHDAEVEILFDSNLAMTAITTNVQYSFTELMVKAAMNTAIGMGTVFVVLILISVIISGFVYIPKIQASFGGKKKTAETTQEAPKAAAPAAPVVESEEELSDDLELVAVIAAAIAASEGAASTDGLVVRSIRRANTNKWQRA